MPPRLCQILRAVRGRCRIRHGGTGNAVEQLRALVVEDNEHMRTLLRTLLVALGVGDVLEAVDGEEALALLAQDRIDFVLTDLSMKPVDGIAFTRQVRLSEESSNPYVPIIMVTGHTEKHRVEAARDAGVTEVLAKPVTAQNLYLRIAEIVERPRPYVRCEEFFGPDRRRRTGGDNIGPRRRRADNEDVVEIG